MNEMISALLVQPNQAATRIEFEHTLEKMQSLVGGMIEFVYPFNDPVAIICNEEGKILNLPLNRSLRSNDNSIYDIIAGDFLLVGLGKEDIVSLTDEQFKKYEMMYSHPEHFMILPDGTVVVMEA